MMLKVTTSVKLPPSMYSMTTHKSPRTRKLSMKLTIFLCLLFCITRISLIIRSFLGCCSRFICLIATHLLLPTSYAENTPPDAPWPILFRFRYLNVGSAFVQIALSFATISGPWLCRGRCLGRGAGPTAGPARACWDGRGMFWGSDC